MKSISLVSIPIAIGCLFGSIVIAGFGALVMFITAIVPGIKLPFYYYEEINLPVWSVVLPVIGMLTLLPIALALAFERSVSADSGDLASDDRRVSKAEFERRDPVPKVA